MMTGTLRRLIFAVAVMIPLILLAFAGTGWSQTPTITSTRIVTVPKGLPVYVDGQFYLTPQVFLWPAGSKHCIEFNASIVGGADSGAALPTGSRFTFTGFNTNKGVPAASTCVISTANSLLYTADPGISEVVGSFSIEHRVRVVYFDCSAYAAPNDPCPAEYSPGTVSIDGSLNFTKSGEAWLSEGVHQLAAYPNPGPPNPTANPQDHASPGWIFVGFYDASGASGNQFLSTFFVRGPSSLYPRFVRARRVKIDSTPSGLKVLADRTTVLTPHILDWGRTTVHTLSVVADQLDNTGKLWVFDSWSDGGADLHAVTIPDGDSPTPLTYTAKYVPGERVSFITNPPLLKLTVDGRSNWQGYNFNWGIGTQHAVSAPDMQKDAQGRIWVFKDWSNGGSATQTITVPSNAGGLGLTLIANFEPQAQIQISSATSGLSVQVDGQDCPLPCLLNRPLGQNIALSVPATLPLGDDARLDFMGWGDSMAPVRTLVTGPEPVALTVSYQRKNRLSARVVEAESVKLNVEPTSDDGFYAAQTQVQLSVALAPGYRFLNWEGDASGTSKSVIVTMDSPKTIRAILDKVPYIAEKGIRNGAGDTPVESVAAGSIVSVLGVNLASELVRGPELPLAQTIANVTVRVGSRILPLFFVSPEQINAQLPSDLKDGGYKMTIRWEGKPEVSRDFTVERNAPGLFYRRENEVNYGLITHENGEPVTGESPARRGETVTVFGTGFGPFLAPAPDGFPLPEADNFRLADKLDLLAGDQTLTVKYAGVAAGRIGMQAVKFAIGEELPSGPSDLKVRINERDSNTVVLVVE